MLWRVDAIAADFAVRNDAHKQIGPLGFSLQYGLCDAGCTSEWQRPRSFRDVRAHFCLVAGRLLCDATKFGG